MSVKGYGKSFVARMLTSKKGLAGWLCVMVAVGGGWILVPQEPSYQGKTLTEWQDEMLVEFSKGGMLLNGQSLPQSIKAYDEHCQRAAQKFEAPLRAMGAGVFPFVLRQLQEKDSRWEIWLRQQCYHHDLTFLDGCQAEKDHLRGAATFMAIQEQVYPRVPELLQQAWQNDQASGNIIFALSWMGFCSDDFLRLLVDKVRHQNRGVGSVDMAYFAFLRLGERGAPVVPQLAAIKADDHTKGKTNHAQFIAELLEFSSP